MSKTFFPAAKNSTGKKCAGVMGWPVAHSLSPRLHSYWLKKYGITGDYCALPVKPENLRQELLALAEKDFCGVNLTVPHKEAAINMVDEVEDLARQVGAINTVVVQNNGKLLGRNTDVFGFSQNLLNAGFKPTTAAAVLLGAGGAARAGLAALLKMGLSDIRIMNRTRAKAEKLAAEFAPAKIKIFAWGDPRGLEDACLLVNSTSLGLQGQPPLEIALDALPITAWVNDMVYVPLRTDLLKHAAARGHKTVDGLGMLLHQARPAFEAFFGIDPEVTPELRAHLLETM